MRIVRRTDLNVHTTRSRWATYLKSCLKETVLAHCFAVHDEMLDLVGVQACHGELNGKMAGSSFDITV